MMKDRQDPFSGMSLEELWQLFPVFLTEHRQVGADAWQAACSHEGAGVCGRI